MRGRDDIDVFGEQRLGPGMQHNEPLPRENPAARLIDHDEAIDAAPTKMEQD
jgi:hypothetical protein